MTEPQAAIDDFNDMNFNYDVETGETIAHTYHWIHSFNTLGHLRSGSADLTADYPAALVFEKNGQLTYVAYNFDDDPRLVTFSDGMAIALPGNRFGIKRSGETPDDLVTDQTPPSQPGVVSSSNLSTTSVTLQWGASSDNVAVDGYDLVVSGDISQIISTQLQVIHFVVLPGAPPNILSGLKVVLAIAWTCVISAEMVGANSGLGFRIWTAKEWSDTGQVLVGMLSINLTVLILDVLFRILERVLLPWQREGRG
jgi:hypothetical protein